jgi:hypothetical protein
MLVSGPRSQHVFAVGPFVCLFAMARWALGVTATDLIEADVT